METIVGPAVVDTAQAISAPSSISHVLLQPFVTDPWGTLQSIATIAAILLGGFWTYWLFVRKRVSRPRVNLSVMAASAPGPEGTQLLQVRAVLVNCGEVLVRLESMKTWVQQVWPIPEEAEKLLAEHDPLDERGEREIQWPMIGIRSATFKKGAAEIEPGESDEFLYDFVVPQSVSEVQVYTYVKNASKKKEIGWGRTLRLQIGSHGGEIGGAPHALLGTEVSAMTNDRQRGTPERVEKQQPPKPQQPPRPRPDKLHEQQQPKPVPPVKEPGRP